MDDMITRGWEDLLGRDAGPLHVRLFIQPVVASLLGIRSGLKDARDRQPVFFWTVVHDPTRRHELARHGWNDVGKLFIAAIILDVIYQVIVLQWFYPVQTLIVATMLAIVPYLVVRGLTNRVASRIHAPNDRMESTRMADDTEAPAAAVPDQFTLAVERTYLAHERTLMAWIRTATSLITFGFTLYKFFFYLHEQDPSRHVEQLLGPRTYGLLMMGTGVFTLALATWQHQTQMKRLRVLYPAPSVSLTTLLAGLIAMLGTLGFIAAIFRS